MAGALPIGECLDVHIPIPDLVGMILEYARYSEAELVFDALMASEFPGHFDIGETFPDSTYIYPFESIESCWINKYPPTKEIADAEGVFDDWTPELRYKFSIGFGHCYGNYEIAIDVTLDDLLPSRGLNIPNVSDHYRDILDKCRPQYIARMGELIRQI